MNGVGIGAPGLDRPLPSPGITAALHVHLATHWPDGDVHVQEWDHEWTGYTATEAADARYRRLKDARSDVERDGLVITLRHDRGEFRTVETLTFADT